MTESSQDNVQVEIGEGAQTVAAGKGITQISGIQSVETLLRSNILSLEGPLALNIENLFSTGCRGLSDPSLHREEELEFLSRMEAFIEEELRKSGDEHFVELSMQFADPTAPQEDRLERSFSLVYGEIEKEHPPIPDLVGLEAALSKYRNLVLLGSPGSGKTTVLQHMALRLIGAYRRKESHFLPIYAPLTKYTREEPTLAFLNRHVLDLIGERQFVASNFLDLAKLGRCILILDGLDQMPDRRSETIRLDRLRALETDLRRMDGAIKWMRRFRQKKWELELIRGRQQVTSQIAPTIDRREREIEKLPDLCASSVITSCRIRDFVGAPSWQSLVVLPMDELQIREFVEKYSPEALDEVQQQWQVTAGTRSLIRNPFYLRMLTQALRRTHQDDKQKKEFIRAVLKRGRLLEFLLRLGIERELESEKRNSDLGVEDVIDSLGQLAYYMLEHNIIGAVPYNVIERWLGKELELILKVAQGANILLVRPGPPISVDFNHQLFLEFLLAFHFRKKSKTKEGFEEGLQLLSRRGDRWAETVNLLVELVDEEETKGLVAKLVEALEESDTWDIATRVLSGIGDMVGPKLSGLLASENELTRRGAVKILGKIKAIQYVNDLASFAGDRSWRVRREAVEALILLKESKHLAAYAADPQPSVLRSVFRGRLLLEDSPVDIIRDVIKTDNPIHQEQMAWATHDLYSALLKRLTETEICELMEDLLEHENNDVKLLSYLMVSQGTNSIKRRLKQKLLDGALNEDDANINYVARKAVSDFLTYEELEKIDANRPKVKSLFPGGGEENMKAMRALSLLTEARKNVNPQNILESLVSAQPAELQLRAQSLAKRGDSTAASVLVNLLGRKDTIQLAVVALLSMGRSGVEYLLAALDDPAPSVQLNTAIYLSFCQLPRKFSRRVRQVLRMNEVRAHPVKATPTDVYPHLSSSDGVSDIGVSLLPPVILCAFTFVLWAVTRSLGAHVPFIYWLRYMLWKMPISPTTYPPVNYLIVPQIEKLAWMIKAVEPDAAFWLARGQLLKLSNDIDAARRAVNKSLELDRTLVPARFEFALIERERGNLAGAQAILEAEDGRYLEEGSDIAAFGRLIEIEQNLKLAPGGTGKVRKERVRILMRLGLWEEAIIEIKELFVSGEEPDVDYRMLYDCYKGIGETRLALAAAETHNADPNNRFPISIVEIDNLRWRHRDEKPDACLTGRFDIFLELSKDEEALSLARQEGWLPDEKEEELSAENADQLKSMEPSLQKNILQLLERLDLTKEAAIVRKSIKINNLSYENTDF